PFHCADSGGQGPADAARNHQSGEHRAKLATDRARYHCACGRAHADLIKLKERCAANTAPVNPPVITTTSWESNPISTTWLRNSFHRSLCVKMERNVSPASSTNSPRY